MQVNILKKGEVQFSLWGFWTIQSKRVFWADSQASNLKLKEQFDILGNTLIRSMSNMYQHL